MSLGAVKRNRHGNAAADGAEIKNAGRFKILEKCQSLFDERFGVRTRNERGGRDVKGASPELLRAHNVGNGFSGLGALQIGVKKRDFFVREGIFRMCDEKFFGFADGCCKQQSRFRTGNASYSLKQALRNRRHAFSPIAASSSARCSF